MVPLLTFVLNAFGYVAGLALALISIITGSTLLGMLRDEFPTVYAVIMWIVGILVAVVMIAVFLTELARRNDRYKAHHRKITKSQRMLTKMHRVWKERKSTDDYDFFHDITVSKQAEPKPLW